MWLIVFIFVAVSASSQTCASLSGQTTVSGAIVLNCGEGLTPPPPPPPPSQVTIPAQSCPPGITGTAYNCLITASGGTTPYAWSSSGSVPAGLSVTNNQITGTPTTPGSYSFTLTVTDASSPPGTASTNLSITVAAPPSNCGFPNYNCARGDATRRNFDLHEIPPDAGPNHCTLPLTACNNTVGLNKIIVEPEYNNAHIVRITDINDITGTGPCKNVGGNVSVGPGGAAEYNVFEKDSNYILLNCGNPQGLKWLNPSTGEVITTLQPQGWALDGSTANVWTTRSPVRFAYSHSGEFFEFDNTQVIARTVANGRVSTASTVVADMSYAVPCWVDVTIVHPTVGECGEWVANHSYPPGSTLCPSCNTWSAATPGSNVPAPIAGTTNCPGTNMMSGACAGPHTFSLINSTACMSGNTQPNWALVARQPGVIVTSAQLTGTDATYTYTPIPNQPVIAVGQNVWLVGTTVGGHSTNANLFNAQNRPVTAVTATTFTVTLPACTTNQTAAGCIPTSQADIPATAQTTAQTSSGNINKYQLVLQDNQCQWADMWIPPQLGGSIGWGAGRVGDSTDTIWTEALSNYKGQDAAGACFAVYYNSNTKIYSHFNTCVGTVYNTICTGGTDYKCTGGIWQQVYVGNALTDNHHSLGTLNGINMHAFFGSKNNTWGYISFSGCALVTTAAVLTNCPAAQANIYLWFPGSQKMLDGRSITNPSVGVYGHMVPGFNTWVYRPPSNSWAVMYTAADFSGIPSGPWPGSPMPVQRFYMNVNDGTCNGGGPGGCISLPVPNPPFVCQPNSCVGPQNGNPALRWIQLGFDTHPSWVSNTGTDLTPICDMAFPSNTSIAAFPPKFAWFYEPFCYQTDGSNRVARQAYIWNSWSMSVPWSNPAGIGSLSSDGNWWAFNSDWYCTLGSANGVGDALCALPFFRSQRYEVGDMLGTNMGTSTLLGRIYKAITAGTTSDTPPVAADYCNAANCTFTNGTVTFQYAGADNAQNSVFLVRLQ